MGGDGLWNTFRNIVIGLAALAIALSITLYISSVIFIITEYGEAGLNPNFLLSLQPLIYLKNYYIWWEANFRQVPFDYHNYFILRLLTITIIPLIILSFFIYRFRNAI